MSLLQLHRISKFFPGVKALEGVDFELEAGEVHALCGENGAGKSTLMHILTGNYQPDEGQILLDGKSITLRDPGHAAALGIAIVYQTRSLTDDMSVAENIFANNHPTNLWGLIDYPALYAQTQAILAELNLGAISPKALVKSLSSGQKQMVELAKALVRKPRILILDEPTAAISDAETHLLFELILRLKKEGVAIIYISHRMAEVFQVAGRVSVLKDGHYQGVWATEGLEMEVLIRHMVGRDIPQLPKPGGSFGEKLLEVKKLKGKGFSDIDFVLHRGEILGMAGLIGAGRTETVRAIFGADPWESGEIWLNGKQITLGHPWDAIQAGMGYVPEERGTLGIFPEMTVAENILVADPAQAIGPFGFRATLQNEIALRSKAQFGIATPTVNQLAGKLSGGNQQKLLLARWLLRNPDVLIVDEPTHGVDVGAKYEIYLLLRRLAEEGKGILLISSDLTEVLALADRVLVFRQGEISGQLSAEEATEESILRLAF